MIRLAAASAALLILAAGPALAAQPIPLRAGTYCGPGDARVVVDVAHDLVEVDGYVCSFPIIAADKLQSQYCTKPGTTTGKQIFDFRVVGRFFSHDGGWYRSCGPVPADFQRPPPTDPAATPAPVKASG
ncbi:hypothetical protein [Lichenibacterium dinghuense]|uniref:hypothetical protein n=1 Tax=Lichenibacterium dinghuense TaxID=2895977 RepID=UPI001F32202D|nr:hypothetical protein [Lichenibacterium sp. 6Y81]